MSFSEVIKTENDVVKDGLEYMNRGFEQLKDGPYVSYTKLFEVLVTTMFNDILNASYLLYKAPRAGKTLHGIEYIQASITRKMFNVVVVPNQTNLALNFKEKCKNSFKMEYIKVYFKSITKPTVKEINVLVKKILDNEIECLICLPSHMDTLNKILKILKNKDKLSTLCIDEIDEVYGSKKSKKISYLKDIIKTVDERFLLMTGTPFLLLWHPDDLFVRELKVIVPDNHVDFIDFKNNKFNIHEVPSIKNRTNLGTFFRDIIPRCSSYNYLGKKRLTNCLITSEFLKDDHEKIKRALRELYPNSIFLISNGNKDKISTPLRDHIPGKNAPEQSMAQIHNMLIKDDDLLDMVDNVFIIGYTKLQRGFSPRSELDIIPDEWSDLLLCTNHICVSRSNDTTHDSINQIGLRLQGLYKGNKDSLCLNLFTTKCTITSLKSYDVHIQKYKSDHIQKDKYKILNIPSLENAYEGNEELAEKSFYGKRPQKTKLINGKYLTTIESQTKEIKNISNIEGLTDFEIDNIRRKFEGWGNPKKSKGKTKVAKLMRRIDPECCYSKDELSKLIVLSGFKNISTIINKLQTETKIKNGYGLILELIDGNYRIKLELVYDFKKIILKQN
jgi:hypothetical protein